MIFDIRKQSPRFYDDLNFPKGFRRCGIFTVLEAEFLAQNGHLMQALEQGKIEPISDDEIEFINVLKDGAFSGQLSVKVWRKYKKAIEQKREKRIFMSEHSGRNVALNY